MNSSIILTCEHAGNQIPLRYRSLFRDFTTLVQSHQGWDPGASELANFLSTQLNVPLFEHHTTRLLVEANRSIFSPELFSFLTAPLSESDKRAILTRYYYPYRERVENAIHQSIQPVLHLSVHSFTPVMNQVERAVDIGLLFDPSRAREAEWCREAGKLLRDELPALRVCFNEPYKGIDDGFTTHLRTRFSNEKYAGIEFEINQRITLGPERFEVQQALATVIEKLR